LSQVSLVIGLDISWSQLLLAKRPSQIIGSGRNTTSSAPGPPAAGAGEAAGAVPAPGRTRTATGGRAVPSTTPLLSVRSHHRLKSPPAVTCGWRPQNSVTAW
jgi:hypothetical protein